MTDIARDQPAPGLEPVDPWTLQRSWLGSTRVPLKAAQPAWQFARQADYFQASYAKAAIALRTVEGLVGRERFARGLRAYSESFRYRHPTGDDLVDSLSEVADEDLGWFFDQAVRGEATPDWTVVEVRQRRPEPPQGLRSDGSSWPAAVPAATAPERWQVEIHLARTGDFVGPVEVGLRWADGTAERRQFSRDERWVHWTVESPQRLEELVVDPDGVWALELERSDNYWRDAPDRTQLRRFAWWLGDSLRALELLCLPWS
jgi:hypothetical protein